MKKSLFFIFLICFTSISFGQYYNVTLDPTGEYQLIIFENSISSLNPGDEIGVFDQNGIQNSGDCSNQLGELLVGAGVYSGSQFDISAIGSLDYCGFGGFQWSGYVEGNPIFIKIYKPDLQMEFIPTITFQAGSGEFGDLLISISELTLEGFGCTDPEALNYDPEAIYDDGNCEYETLIDAPTNLTADGGDGNIALMWNSVNMDGNRADVTLWISDVTEDNIEISMINTVAAVNFQFDIIAGENLEAFIISANGGIAETLGYNVVTNPDGLVLGYSLSLTPIPPGEYVLVNIEWAHTGDNDFIDLGEGIFPEGDPPYNELSINYGAPYCYGNCFDPSDITYNLYRDGLLYDGSIDYTIYDDGGLGYSETHCYTVTATDGTSESGHSNEACATTFSSGCADPEACNYDPDSVIDDDCWYPEDEGWCDCDGNILDCAGVCGGTAYFDECGLCDDIPENDNDCMPNPPENLTAEGGLNNISLQWEAPSQPANRNFAYLYISDATDEFLEISLSNDVNVHGVQFNIDAEDLQPVFNGIGGGSSEESGFESFVNENGLVLGYDIAGGYIPPGNSVLLYVYWDIQGTDAWISLDNIIVAAINGEIVNVNPTPHYCYGECSQIITYNIYRDNLLIAGGIENLFFTDNSVEDIEIHEYYVTAFDGYFESQPSNSAFANITYLDCFGTPDGSAIIDACGYCCDGDTGVECSYWANSIDFGGAYDCYGQCDGSAYNNECGCVEGSTGDDFDFCYGCTDPDAINYDPEALFECNGDNSCCEYPPPDPDINITFGNADYWNDRLEIMISSQVDVHSFSIDFFGTNIIDVFGGLSEDMGFTIAFTDSHVEGEAQEALLPASLGTLFYFELDNLGYAQFIISSAIFYDEYGQEILTDYFDTFEWTPDGGWGSCEDQGLYTDCDGNCFEENYLDWQGDGYCDDNSFGINLFCDLWDYDQGDCTGEPLLYLDVDGITENGWFSIENAILSGYGGNQLDVQIGPPLIIGDGGSIPIPETEVLPDWQVYISITNYEDNQIEVSINNTVGIAGFQFQLINGFEELILEGGGGGSASEAGFMISTNNSGLVLGFSLTGSSIDDLDTCDSDQFSDCENDCYPITDMIYLGNGDCNDNSPNLDCSKWWFDDGDCIPYQEMDCAGVVDGDAFENECGCVGGTTGLEPDFCYGCTDPDAENYDPDALFECYGDNSCCEYPPPSTDVEITFGYANYSDNTLELMINSFVEVSNFEIDFYGTNIIDVFGGVTSDYGYNIDFTSTHVQGDPQGAGNLPASNETLFFLELDNPGFAQIIISLVSFYDENGEELLVNYFDSFEWAQTSECDDQGLYTDCEGNCFGENYLNWHGDGYCDDGAYSVNLFCDVWDYDLGDCSGDPLTFLVVDGITDNGWFSIEDPIFSGSPGQPQLTVQVGPPLMIGNGGDVTVPETIIYSDWDVFISITNYENNVLEISMNNSTPIAGFQFQIVTGFENFSLLGASGGSADEVPGFQVSTSNEGMVLAFTFGNGSIDEIDSCEENQFSDCDDICYPIDNLIYLGDGECNDGSDNLPNMNCSKWWFDDADCEYWEYDCAGVPGGDAYENECGCIGGSTGLEPDFCYGCLDPNALNYDEQYTIYDGSCYYCTPGDVNGDGGIDILDYVALLNYIEFGGEYNPCMDYNGDGSVDGSDGAIIYDYVIYGFGDLVPETEFGYTETTMCKIEDDPLNSLEITISHDPNIVISIIAETSLTDYYEFENTTTILMLDVAGNDLFYTDIPFEIINLDAATTQGENQVDLLYDACDFQAPVFGCSDPEACNYNPEVTVDDGSCTFPDCAGDCYGDAFENECGCVEGSTGLDEHYCYGCTDPYAVNYDEDATIDDGSCIYESQNGIFISNVTDQYIEIFMSNDEDVYGFQFNLVADGILEAEFGYASGGSASEHSFILSTNLDGLVLGFALTGSFIPAGNAILCYVEWTHADTSGFISIDNTIFSGAGGSQMDFDNGDPFQFDEGGDYIYGCTDPEALNYNPYANYDDDSCIYPTPELQIIELNEGINWVSFFVRPTEMDMQSILQPLIDNDVLISATDVFGNQLYDSGSGWINEIGDMSNIDCYFIHVTSAISLNLFGLPVILPVEIPLIEGENYIGYPVNVEQNIENVFSELVDNGSVISVFNDSGGSYFPEYGLNSIGNLIPGEGYQVVTTEDAILQVCEPGGDCDDAVYGCTDPNALNYNPYATVNDGSCEYCNYGDVNNDGGIDILDVVEILNAILTGDEINECADINQDGEITIIDIVNMINFVLGNVEPGYGDVVQIIYTENTACFDADGNVGALEFVLTHDEEFQLYITAETFMADYVTTGNTTNIILLNPIGTELFISVGDFQITEVNAYTDEAIFEVDLEFGDCIIESEILGCTDPAAVNYNPYATINDNSCIYAENYPDWQITVDDYNYYGSIFASITLNDGSDGTEYDLLAAFNENELRGISHGEYDPDIGSYLFPITVYSNTDSGESLSFQYFNLDSDQIYTLNENIDFASGMQIGSVENPFQFTNLYYDCADVPNGDNYLDLCDICDDNPENDSHYNGVDDFGGGYDCGGLCFGIAYIDDDGYCIAPFDPEADDWSYDTDCNDVVEGVAFLDDCGMCSGGNTDHEPNICSEEIGEDMICWGQFSGPDFDGCGECSGSDRDADCMGVCFGDAYIDQCEVCDDDPTNDDLCVGCMDQIANNYDPDAWIDCENCCLYYPTHFENYFLGGAPSLVIISNIDCFSPGDEIGLFDINGLINYGNCDSLYGEILVGSGLYTGSQMNISTYSAVDNCQFGGTQLPGFIEGNDIIIKAWDADEELEYTFASSQINYIIGEGSFGGIFTQIEIDACADVQAIDVNASMWNNISLNIMPLEPEVEDVFDPGSTLIIRNDQAQYYIPEYDVNLIGEVEVGEGYEIYLSSENSTDIILAGSQIDPDISVIQLMPLFWNNIAYLPEFPMSVEGAFEDIPILIIKDSNGLYYIPSYNVNTIDANGGMQPGRGYFVYTDSEDAIDFIYPDDPLVRMELTAPAAELNMIDTDYFQCSPSGRSFPLIITAIDGPYEIGDELAVLANDAVVGALKISDMNFPKVLTTWRGFAQFDIQIDGWLAGDEFSLQIWDESENTSWEIHPNISIDTSSNIPYSELILDVIDYSIIPEEFKLQQAYPNPFNSEITIEYAIAKDVAVSISVYDLLGRSVTKLVNENQQAGNYSITWQANEITSGIYFLNMTASDYSSTQRIILLK
ncbi:MAG: T9SS type A sorting domain-containing protein [Candidatus Marinimicrobia bacterium]|jgi:hypothetical protein|nr:T9SS type A sorting domain-containing protein [Candidatus Neomarinimicrobiota bacterium]MBT3634380.1 T9SS type A sorting domain-containing protein [Candidatus Neomarinimicrobiota bacterium]MBT3681711.1 T9SS type A sorting domain-containing protein [Candidatus Neomarinimicrobiota bacterium]MBT3759437.1 T9SS type A sorting domain-containing protein [Candidatus Neomarinimicrobiota bacterium]MBT3895925.1 T9SS type A sorting domain-containing protein [Candidatus Neomarinimicrobiota bacterium]